MLRAGSQGRASERYVEKSVRVRSTCLVQYARNRYSVPSQFAKQHVSLGAYAGRIVLMSGQEVIAGHKRRFTRNVSYFESWHNAPLLNRRPGALRDGGPFGEWQLLGTMHLLRECYITGKGGAGVRRTAFAGAGSWDRSGRDDLRTGSGI
ncbi:Mu transposase domain-containing protein [Roseobacter sp. SK209-2-6]|uniref:Mu transposase domain-containing protein n=1 Tax=Roseobacter sp. SK209-2-6 TaxID=388739 RepID=UPI003FA47FB5